MELVYVTPLPLFILILAQQGRYDNYNRLADNYIHCQACVHTDTREVCTACETEQALG